MAVPAQAERERDQDNPVYNGESPDDENRGERAGTWPPRTASPNSTESTPLAISSHSLSISLRS